HDVLAAEYSAMPEHNELIFRDGITAADVVVSRIGSDLRLTIGVDETVTVKQFFQNDDPYGNRYNPLQLVRFADGTQWDVTALIKLTLAPTEGA
ncbi:TPA: hypothetical protein RQN76_004460, partial [Aeromonas dhakensis]|nr:hypothetical protein [Aeromonas dhakensis]